MTTATATLNERIARLRGTLIPGRVGALHDGHAHVSPVAGHVRLPSGDLVPDYEGSWSACGDLLEELTMHGQSVDPEATATLGMRATVCATWLRWRES